MISTCGHTAVASKTSMSECQSLLCLDPRQTDRREFHVESAADTMSAILQTVQPTGVALSTVYEVRSDAKYIGGLFTFNSRFLFQKLMKLR